MPNIVANCVVLDDLCIVNNEVVEDKWIVEVKNKQARRVSKGEIQEESELWGERVEFVEMKRNILAREDIMIANEINDVEKHLFLLE